MIFWHRSLASLADSLAVITFLQGLVGLQISVIVKLLLTKVTLPTSEYLAALQPIKSPGRDSWHKVIWSILALINYFIVGSYLSHIIICQQSPIHVYVCKKPNHILTTFDSFYFIGKGRINPRTKSFHVSTSFSSATILPSIKYTTWHLVKSTPRQMADHLWKAKSSYLEALSKYIRF